MGSTGARTPAGILLLLHAEAPLGWTAWHWDPLVLAGLVAWGIVWWLIIRRFPPSAVQKWYGWGAFVILVLALTSPLASGAEVSFTLHMGQHLLLMLAVAPLLALGTPAGFLGWLRHRPLLGPAVRALWLPLPAFIVYHVVLLGWHVPLLYAAAVRFEGLHLVQHATFLLGALAFWGVVVAPDPRLVRATVGQRIVMVLAANILSWALSFVLAIAERPLYPVYRAGALPWGLSALTDMRLGGAVMWVAGNLVSGIALMRLLGALMRQDEGAGGEAA